MRRRSEPQGYAYALFLDCIRFLVCSVFLTLAGTVLIAHDEIALSPLEASEWKELSELMLELRKIQRDDLFVPVARLQLLYLTNQINAGLVDEQELAHLRKEARGVAFNIAAFTWPGWDDTGPITPERQTIGLSAARVALDLAKDANDVTFNALWINGAHLINAKKYTEAKDFFTDAVEHTESDSEKKMGNGWVALCDFLDDSTEEQETKLSELLDELRSSDEENGDYFADQIEVAKDVFTR